MAGFYKKTSIKVILLGIIFIIVSSVSMMTSGDVYAEEIKYVCACRQPDTGSILCEDLVPTSLTGCGYDCTKVLSSQCLYVGKETYHCNCPSPVGCVEFQARLSREKNCELISSGCKSVSIASGPCPISTNYISVSKLKTLTRNYLNPAKFASPSEFIGRVIKLLIYPIGAFALVLYIYAGVLWLISAGAQERIEQSKKVLFWTTLGLIATLSSYIITKSIMTFLTG